MKDILEFQSVTDFLNETKYSTFALDIDFLKYCTPTQFFKYRFKKALIIKNAEVFKNYSIEVVNNVLEEYLLESLCFDEIHGFEKISFIRMLTNEREELKALLSNLSKENEIKIVKDYHAFLNENFYTTFRIDILKKDNNSLYSHFLILIEGKVNPVLIDAQKIETTFNAMLTRVDNNYLYQLLNFDNSEYTLQPTKDLYNNFDLEYYKNPILLQEFEEEKTIYLKIFKSYIKETLHKRKTILRLDKLPLVYQYLEEYAESLLPKNQIEKTEIEKKTVENIEYPKYIFNNSEDYILFNQLMKVASNPTQVSYFFRVMSEKEKPAKIIVKDTPFREWFNSQDYEIELSNHTQTLINSENKDRKALYELAKSLLSDSSKKAE